ncbi:GMC oxidoreductase [Rhypophila decipiens]|uniref:GMC oxidoreductase n=1 Tax=Rhypophila decipiens TaxID=261697 RepID=A0AAN6XY87_9PEZI|nr:GMC oxidoreductase [Rhypophila decipiens]
MTLKMKSTCSWLSILFLVLLPTSSSSPDAEPRHSLKRTQSSLLSSYDFIICGAGTTGLTIADRLSSAFPSKTVLVIEYGELEAAPGVFDPPTKEYTPLDFGAPRASSWDLVSLPSPALNNGTAFLKAGKAVGGSSAINGQFFDRASKHDFDDGWSPLQVSMTDRKVPIWDWKGMEPFYKKSVNYNPPGKDTVDKYGYTWDETAWNENSTSSKVQATMASFLWADHSLIRKAFQNMGIWLRRECMDGNKEGICWTPNAQDAMTGQRSFAGSAHYTEVVANRSNYHLLTGHQVTRVVFPQGLKDGGWGGEVPLVEVRGVGNQGTFNITAAGEVIISAGALHSPAILQRSGIGPKDFLQQLKIPVIVDLPGVGSNLQDHSGPTVEWNYSQPLNIHPMPPDMANSTFLSEAFAAWNQRPARGPYTIAMSMTSIWVPLANITANYTFILDKINDLVSLGDKLSTKPDPKTLESLTAALHLPPSYASSSTLLKGYLAQLSSISSLLANPKSPSLESAFTTGTTLTAVLNHPLSRGTVRLNPSSPLDLPILDYRSASNPIDLDMHLLHTQYLRRTIPALQFLFTDPEAFQSLGFPNNTLPFNLTVTETQPGQQIQSEDAILNWIRSSTVQSFMHPCCTNAMMPLEKGGVVDTHLRVHNAGGRLRVADASIFPLEPSSHLSSLCYAVGEKAADLIIKEWSE